MAEHVRVRLADLHLAWVWILTGGWELWAFMAEAWNMTGWTRLLYGRWGAEQMHLQKGGSSFHSSILWYVFTFISCWLHRTVLCPLCFFSFPPACSDISLFNWSQALLPPFSIISSAAIRELTLLRRAKVFLLSTLLSTASLIEREERRRWWEGCRLRNFSTALLPILDNWLIWKNWNYDSFVPLITFG